MRKIGTAVAVLALVATGATNAEIALVNACHVFARRISR
jgi:DNA-binding CsgD family transcriptional regulator